MREIIRFDILAFSSGFTVADKRIEGGKVYVQTLTLVEGQQKI